MSIIIQTADWLIKCVVRCFAIAISRLSLTATLLGTPKCFGCKGVRSEYAQK